MEVKKMSLANIRGKLSREEMSKILAGDVGAVNSICDQSNSDCSYYESGTGMVDGNCVVNSLDQCVCKSKSGRSSVVHQDCITA